MSEPVQTCRLCGRQEVVRPDGRGFPPDIAKRRLQRACKADGCACDPQYTAGLSPGLAAARQGNFSDRDCAAYDPAALEVTAGRTKRQDAIAELIGRTVTEHGIDFGGADVVAVHAETIGYRVLDALRDAGLTVTRRRSR